MSGDSREQVLLSGWDASCELAFEAGLKATPEQRLAWLESAIELAHLAGVLPRSEPDSESVSADKRER